MEMGCDPGLSPIDYYMAGVSGLKLKRIKSPPKMTLSLEIADGADNYNKLNIRLYVNIKNLMFAISILVDQVRHIWFDKYIF